jgi:hypothetical protein
VKDAIFQVIIWVVKFVWGWARRSSGAEFGEEGGC